MLMDNFLINQNNCLIKCICQKKKIHEKNTNTKICFIACKYIINYTLTAIYASSMYLIDFFL